MKSLTYIVLALGFSLTGCSSQKKLADTAPFETGAASCQSWVGGRPESGSGMKLEVPITTAIPENVTLKQAFFRGKAAEIKLATQNGQTMAKANFMNRSSEKPDIIMHADPKKEVGNRPPMPKIKMPMELALDECAVSYEEAGELKYLKISGVKEKKPLAYQ